MEGESALNEYHGCDSSRKSTGSKPVYSTDENGQQYCCIGNTRIKVIEHFPATGKTIVELMGDMILADAHLDG